MNGGEPGMAVDARAGIPARVGLAGVVHLHGDDVIAGEVEVWRELVSEADIAEGALAKVVAVDPDFGIHVDAVELDGDFAVAPSRRHAEGLAIPADARGREAACAAAGIGVDEGAFDRPVVWEIERAPLGVGE